MIKKKNIVFCYFLLAAFIITSAQVVRAVPNLTIHKNSAAISAHPNLTGLPFYSSSTTSNSNILLATEEELEEDEDTIEKNHLPVLILPDIFFTFFLQETQNHFPATLQLSGSLTSIPLHIAHCAYLI